MKLHAAAALAASTLFAVAPAAAAVSASATFTDFGYTLFDLNPGDGIDASITFTVQQPGSFGTSTSAQAQDNAVGVQASSAQAVQLFAPLSSFAAVAQTSAVGMTSGALSSGMDFVSSGSASATVDGATASFSAAANAGSWGTVFTLSPNTLVVFSGAGTASATTTVGGNNFGTEFANAGAGISITGIGPSGTGSQSSSASVSAYASATYLYYDWITNTWIYEGQSTMQSGDLSASFVNYTGGTLDGSISVTTSASGSTPVAAVPEPGTWLLMFAGIAAVSARARQRAR